MKRISRGKGSKSIRQNRLTYRKLKGIKRIRSKKKPYKFKIKKIKTEEYEKT